MEREKQKKMERERIEQEKKEAEKREQAEKEAMDDMTNDGEPHVPKKSRFVSECVVSNLSKKHYGAMITWIFGHWFIFHEGYCINVSM